MRRCCFTSCRWIVCVFAACAWGYSGGSGTPDDPYQLAAAADIVELSQTERDWSKHFVLTAHIDLQGHAWSSAVIGEFRGSLDGAGYEIRNLAVSGEAPSRSSRTRAEPVPATHSRSRPCSGTVR